MIAQAADAFDEITFLENRISKLDNDSFFKFREWFIQFDQARWDKQLENDSNEGKLDFLINATLSEYRTDNTKDI